MAKGQDLSAAVASARTLGTGATQAAAGDHSHAAVALEDWQLDGTSLRNRLELVEARHAALVGWLMAAGFDLPPESVGPPG